MPVVFDSHVHCFPPMADDDVHLTERVAELQHHVRFHGQGVRRTRDHSVVSEPVLVGEKDGISWQPDVGIRFGKFGRLEFTHGGEELYMQWMPPTLWDMSSPAEYIIAQMDYAGVNRGFMQHDRLYGYLDEFFADCVSRYPDRLVAGAQVDEWRGGEPDQLARLRRQVEELGASALYFSTGGFFHNDFSTGVNHESLRPLWDLVADLGIPIHWSPCAMLVPIAEDYIRELRELNEWADNYPQIASVLTHGLSNIFLEKGSPDRYRIPPEIASLLERDDWYMELMLHLMAADVEFPPYQPDLREVVRRLVTNFGAEKLVWGSDMPCCERTVTYKQSRLLFDTQCDFLTTEQHDAIMGGNLDKLYPL